MLTLCQHDEGRTSAQNAGKTHKPAQDWSSGKWTRVMVHLRTKQERQKESESQSLLGFCLCVGEGTTPNA